GGRGEGGSERVGGGGGGGGGPGGRRDRARAVAEAGAALVEAGVREDIAPGQLDAVTDGADQPHARDRDVDLVALDALPARQSEAVRRVDGLDRSVQAVRAAHAAVLLLHE